MRNKRIGQYFIGGLDTMRAAFSFVGILMVLGIGYFIYSTQIQSGPDGEPLPQQTNLIAVRQGLLPRAVREALYGNKWELCNS